MKNYTEIVRSEEFKTITIRFYNEKDKLLEIGEKMNQINKEAYMNGYNWDIFFNHYLSKNRPELLEGLESDPEAGSYFAHYALTTENQKKAELFLDMIIDLIENENKIYDFMQEEDQIEWD